MPRYRQRRWSYRSRHSPFRINREESQSISVIGAVGRLDRNRGRVSGSLVERQRALAGEIRGARGMEKSTKAVPELLVDACWCKSCIWTDWIAGMLPVGPTSITATKTSCACAPVLGSVSASSLGHYRQPSQKLGPTTNRPCRARY